LFWQDNAFGVLSVNERSLIQDAGGGTLVLGTGGILDRYDYVSDSVGATDKHHVVASASGVYWVNTKDRSVYRFTSALENLSKNKAIQSWVESRLLPTTFVYETIRSVFDKRYSNVMWSFYNSNISEGVTLVFDENIDTFTGFYDFYTNHFVTYPEGYLSVYRIVCNTDILHYQNSLLKHRCCIHSYIPSGGADEELAADPCYVDSTVKVVFNDDYNYTKVFDNVMYVSTATENDVEIYDNTFSSIRCYNNYQNSDYYTLTYGNTYTPEAGVLPLQRDEREWTLFVPRNSVNQTYTSSPDIFDAGNLDKTRLFRERMRDKYMVTDFVYTNNDTRRFVVPYIGIKYRVSYR
jgi:hypothetical protein